MGITFIDFFAGIGGIRKGMENMGHKCVGFCEFDRFAAASYISMHCITEEQREYLATMDLKKRQKEILKEEYLNGEWYRTDIRNVRADELPRSDCWCFGAPCQDFSVAGRREGLDGERSSLVREIFRLIGETREEDRPEWLLYENVKGMLSSNRGFDFLAILLEMDRWGYDIQWQLLNSKHHGVPQNRERVFTVGHIRNGRRSEIFPIEGANGENRVQVKQIGVNSTMKRDNPQAYRVYDKQGVSPTLTNMGGGGREPHTIECISKKYVGIEGKVRTYEEETPTLSARDYKEPICCTQIIKGNNAVCGVREYEEEAPTLRNGMFGLKVKFATELENGNKVYAVWYEKKQCYIAIRKLTPKECFRLQGFDDEDFEKAKFVNSDSQLYKQAGNAVTVSVIEAIAERLDK